VHQKDQDDLHKNEKRSSLGFRYECTITCNSSDRKKINGISKKKGLHEQTFFEMISGAAGLVQQTVGYCNQIRQVWLRDDIVGTQVAPFAFVIVTGKGREEENGQASQSFFFSD
jgi:hypothetical protein